MANGNDNPQSNSNNYHYSKDEVHSDYIGSDKYYGKVSVSKGISFSQTAQNENSNNFERLYRAVYVTIERRAEDPQIPKAELIYIAENIYQGAVNNDPETLPLLRRWLHQLNALAPDVYLICVTTLTSPMSNLSPAITALVHDVRQSLENGPQLDMQVNEYLEIELKQHHLPQNESDKMRQELNELQSAVTNGNVQPVRQILQELTTALPGMRQPLRHWLVDSTEVPTAIKVFARNYLDRPI